MRRILSGILIGLGILMILGAAGLLLYNQQESEREASFFAQVLPHLSQEIQARAAHGAAETLPLEDDPRTGPREMTVCRLDGWDYIGIFSIPSISYEAPILADWSLEKLAVSACRFHGSTFAGNLVLCAHNYNSLYRRLGKLKTGDEVLFTDMDGLIWTYEVADLEVLEPDMVTEMNDSGYDLTFFTCTYGGQARLTLRCVRS